MATPPKTIQIGSYTTGEIPEALVYSFLDASGDPLSLVAGFTAAFVLEKSDGTDVTIDAVVTNGETGEVALTWPSTAMNTAGLTQGQFWAGNGAVRYSSPIFVWRIVDAVGTAPSI